MEWNTEENNDLDTRKIYAAIAVLIAIVAIFSAMYYFWGGKVAPEEGVETVKTQLTEQEKVEIEKNLTSQTPESSLTKKEKAAIEKNFVNSGTTLTEEEKSQIEKNFGL